MFLNLWLADIRITYQFQIDIRMDWHKSCTTMINIKTLAKAEESHCDYKQKSIKLLENENSQEISTNVELDIYEYFRHTIN